jgi:hypothetical protein
VGARQFWLDIVKSFWAWRSAPALPLFSVLLVLAAELSVLVPTSARFGASGAIPLIQLPFEISLLVGLGRNGCGTCRSFAVSVSR